MRDYAGISYGSLPGSGSEDLAPRLRQMLGVMDYFLRDISRGMGRIQNGEVPDGSGTSLSGVTDHGLLTGLADDDHTQYLLLAGRSGGQIAYGATGANGTLTLSSTAASDKGAIYLGSGSLAAFLEDDALLGVGTVSPLARVHGIARDGAGPVLLPSSDVNTNWAGPYQGSGGTPLVSSHFAAISSDNGDTSYIGFLLNSPDNGTNPQICGLSGSVQPGRLWIGTVKIRSFSASSVCTIYLGVIDSAGNKFMSAAAITPTATTTWTEYPVSIDATGTPSGTGTPNSIVLDGTGAFNTYLLVTYMTLTLDAVGSYAEAVTAQAIGASGANVLSVRGDTYSEILMRVLDTGVTELRSLASSTANLLDFSDNGTVRAYHRFDGKLFISHPNSGSSYNNKLIRLESSGVSGNLVDFISCYDAVAAAEVFKVGPDGGIATGSIGLLDYVFAGTNRVTFFPVSVFATGDWVILVPDASAAVTGEATMVLASDSGLRFHVLLNVSSTLRANTASSGVSFEDQTTSSKKLRTILSGAVGNNTLTLTNSAARNYGFGNLSGNVVVVGDDPPSVASGNLGKVDLTAQAAAIGATNLSNTPPAGLYLIQYYLESTTADVTAGTIQFQIDYTDHVGATNQTGAALAMTATGRDRGEFVAYVASGNISYQTNVVGIFGTAKYALTVRVVSLG